MAESADSLFRRGAISPKQAKKRGFLKGKGGPAPRPNEEPFENKAGLKDQGGIRDNGAVKVRRAIDERQAEGPKPSKGAGVENGKGGFPKRNAIDQNTGKEWPSEKNASAKTPENPRSKGRIPKKGGQYGGGGRDTQ